MSACSWSCCLQHEQRRRRDVHQEVRGVGPTRLLQRCAEARCTRQHTAVRQAWKQSPTAACRCAPPEAGWCLLMSSPAALLGCTSARPHTGRHGWSGAGRGSHTRIRGATPYQEPPYCGPVVLAKAPRVRTGWMRGSNGAGATGNPRTAMAPQCRGTDTIQWLLLSCTGGSPRPCRARVRLRCARVPQRAVPCSRSP